MCAFRSEKIAQKFEITKILLLLETNLPDQRLVGDPSETNMPNLRPIGDRQYSSETNMPDQRQKCIIRDPLETDMQDRRPIGDQHA